MSFYRILYLKSCLSSLQVNIDKKIKAIKVIQRASAHIEGRCHDLSRESWKFSTVAQNGMDIVERSQRIVQVQV